jgi:hypothetical protein
LYQQQAALGVRMRLIDSYSWLDEWRVSIPCRNANQSSRPFFQASKSPQPLSLAENALCLPPVEKAKLLAQLRHST